METSKNLNPVVPLHTTRSVPVSHRLTAFWHTMIGKKVVMAVTGIVFIGFVILPTPAFATESRNS